MTKNPILSIFLTVFIDMLGVGVIIPVFAPLIVQNDLGIIPMHYTEAERQIIYGLLTATFAIFQFFGAPILGALADRHGRKRILNITLVGTFFGYILFAYAIYARQLWLIFIARAIPGFMGGNISIALAALADLSNAKSKAKNFGLVGMAFGLGFILGPFIGGILGNIDYALPFWFTAGLTLVNIILVYVQFPETFIPTSVRKLSLLTGIHNIGKAITYKEMRIILLVLFLQAFGFTFFTQFFSVFMIHKFAVSKAQIGQIFGFVGIWIAFTQGVLTRVFSRFKPEAILRFSLLGMALAIFAQLFPDTMFMVFAVQPLLAISQGLTQPNMTSVVSSLGSRDNQGEVMGIQSSVQSLAFAIPPILAGFLSGIDYRYPIVAGAICLLLSGLVFVFLFKPITQPQASKG
jgi:MFS transporter, DHA1 family, tetracycline resistance protein